MLSDRCLSVCPVYDVGALWPNGWTDQDETCCEINDDDDDDVRSQIKSNHLTSLDFL